MDLKEWLSLCPPDVASTLRSRRDGVLLPMRPANYRELSIAYRYAVRATMAYREPRHAELPSWLRPLVKPGQYHAIREAVLGAVRDLADAALSVKHETHIVFADDEDLERKRRVVLYAKRWEGVLERFGAQVDETTIRRGPAAVSVWCLETLQPFQSVRKAAEWLSRQAGREVARSEIKKAIRAKTACCGHHFAFGDGKPVIVANGNERPVYCVTAGRWFDSHREAYEFAGVNKHAFARAMAGDGKAGAHAFNFTGPAKPERPKRQVPRAYSDRYPLLAYMGVQLNGLAIAG